jgi:hypothetical protein
MLRRFFLRSAGVLTIAAVGGGIWRAWDQGVFDSGNGPAFEPWDDWRNTKDSPLTLVSAAILAASPHNTQPWLFQVSESSIDMYIDTSRNVGALDPYLREAHIGLGCALENLLRASAPNGYAASVTLPPAKLAPIPTEPNPQLVARVKLTKGARKRDELYEAIPQRRTNRSRYNPHLPLPADFLKAIAHVPDSSSVKLFLYTSEVDRQKIADLSLAAMQELYGDRQVQEDTKRWVRLRWNDVEKFRDGLTVDGFGLNDGEKTMAKMMPDNMLERVVSQRETDDYSDLMMSSPLIGIIAVRDRYDREQCLVAGRTWQRLHLFATTKEVAARPCNEGVQIIDYERAAGKAASRLAMFKEITHDPAWQPTFIFCMGYSRLPASASPRRPVEWVQL